MKKQFLIFLAAITFTLVLANPYAESQEPPKPPIVIAVDGLYFGEIGPKPVEKIMKTIFPDKTPDGYLGKSFKENIPASIKNLNPEIKTYTWSRDPADTRGVVDDLKTNIKQAYEVAKNDNRSLIIVGHSWGSAMSYKALEELGSEVKVDSFVTMGSPLNADNVAVKKFTDSKFKEIEIISSTTKTSTPAVVIEHPLKIEKPKGVDKWINYWANGDIISGSIPSADRNIQIDKGKETLSASQRHTIPTSGLDLGMVKTATEKWHGAYYSDNEWKENIAVNVNSAVIRHEIKTVANQAPLNVVAKTVLPIAINEPVKGVKISELLPYQGNAPSSDPTQQSLYTTQQQLTVVKDLPFTQTFSGGYEKLSESPYIVAIYGNTDPGSGVRTGAYPGAFTANYSITATSTENNTFSSYSSGTFNATMSGKVSGFLEGTLKGTGTMNMTSQTTGGTQFNLSGPITIEPSGKLTSSTNGTFTLGGNSGTTTGTWVQTPK